MKFSSVADNIMGQPMFDILSTVQNLERSGKEILHFELGQPDFNTPQNIKEAGIEAIEKNYTQYAPSGGVHDFKLAIQNATLTSRYFKPDLNQILVTPGANSIIYLALKCILDPGDEVIIPNPGFPTYFSAISALAGVAVPLQFASNLTKEELSSELNSIASHKTKAIIINSPCNPTGEMLTRDQIKEIYNFANSNKLLLISDEIYSRIIFDEGSFFSPSYFDNCVSNTLILNGFSKAFSMTGWRLGVAIGPAPLIQKMEHLTSTIVSCVPPFIQYAGLEALTGSQDSVREMVAEYQTRAELLVNGLNTVNGIACSKPKGSIYAFPNIEKTGLSSQEFCETILTVCNIAVTPGHCFGSAGEGYVRFSTVSSTHDITKAVNRLQNYFGCRS